MQQRWASYDRFSCLCMSRTHGKQQRWGSNDRFWCSSLEHMVDIKDKPHMNWYALIFISIAKGVPVLMKPTRKTHFIGSQTNVCSGEGTTSFNKINIFLWFYGASVLNWRVYA